MLDLNIYWFSKLLCSNNQGVFTLIVSSVNFVESLSSFRVYIQTLCNTHLFCEQGFAGLALVFAPGHGISPLVLTLLHMKLFFVVFYHCDSDFPLSC